MANEDKNILTVDGFAKIIAQGDIITELGDFKRIVSTDNCEPDIITGRLSNDLLINGMFFSFSENFRFPLDNFRAITFDADSADWQLDFGDYVVVDKKGQRISGDGMRDIFDVLVNAGMIKSDKVINTLIPFTIMYILGT